MKKIILGIVILAGVGMVACDGSKRLASNLVGLWSGVPERIADNEVASATFLPTFDFSRSGNTKSGTLTLNALVNISTPISSTAVISTPFSMSASATSSITGQWEVVSDDDVVIRWDNESLKVIIDPDAVVLTSNNLEGTVTSSIDSLKPAIVSNLQAQVTQAVKAKILGIHKLDDVKIKNGIMEYEVNDVDYTMQQQGRN